MTVEELIQVLQQQDPKAEAVVSGYEGGYKEVKLVEAVTLVPHFYNQHWMGPHETFETVKNWFSKTPDTTITGVVLS